MKICFVSWYLGGLSGGAERSLRDVAVDLAARGHKVDVVSPDSAGFTPFTRFSGAVNLTGLHPAGARKGRLARQIVKYLRRGGLLKRLPLLGALAWRVERGSFIDGLERHLEATRPDVAIAFGPVPMAALAAAKTSFELPRIGSIRTRPAMEFAHDPTDPFPYQTEKAIRALSTFDRITVLLPEFRDWFTEPLRSRVRDVPNIVDVPIGLPDPSERENLIISVGRLVREKRQALLLDAWARIEKEFPDWRLEFHGTGYQHSALQAKIDELGIGQRTILKGMTRDMDAVYARARLMVHPSEQEGFGLAVAEALSHGIPVIGFADCTGVNTLIRDGKNGRLVIAADRAADALADALANLLADPGQLDAMAEAAPASMVAYAPETVIARWESVLREVVPQTSDTTDEEVAGFTACQGNSRIKSL